MSRKCNPEQLTAIQQVRKPIALYRMGLASVTSIQLIPSQPVSPSFILILSSHISLGLPSGLFTSGSLIKILHALFISHAC